MRKIIKKAALVMLIGSFLTLAACSLGGSAEPTTNPDMVYTAAAQTVQAQLTSAAGQQAQPNAEMAATSAVQTFQAQLTGTAAAVTATQDSFQVPTIGLSTNTGVPQQGTTPGQPIVTFTPIVMATMTFTPPPPSNDKYELVEQDPDDNSTLPTNTRFDMVWEIKNTGTTTWNTMYTVEFFLFDRIGAGEKNRYYFREVVAPGQTTQLIVDMFTPTTPGTYYSWWKLKNDYGANFGDISVTLIVQAPAATP
jgi:hypothetical protein